jgi:hypothetical protein
VRGPGPRSGGRLPELFVAPAPDADRQRAHRRS